MQKILPHLWLDKNGAQAGLLYAKTFPDSKVLDRSRLGDTPSGEVEILTLSLAGYRLMLLAAGPEFKVNPSLSFLVYCPDASTVDSLHQGLSQGGSDLMPPGEYPFSPWYVWTQDAYGVSWQLIVPQGEAVSGIKIIPTQMFVGKNCGRAQEAMDFYTSVFHGRSLQVSHYGPGMEPDKPEAINHGAFELAGQTFALMDSAYPHEFAFNEALSYVVNCDTQAEIDAYWEALSAVPEAEQCGWLKDKFGFSWQIVPSELGSLMAGDEARTRRVTEAFLHMRKFDLEKLRAAARG